MSETRSAITRRSSPGKLAYIIILVSYAYFPSSVAFSLARLFGFGAKPGFLQHVGDFAPNDPRAVPTFLIIGTAKGGTTDLYFQLVDSSVSSDTERPDPAIQSHMKEPALLHHVELATANFTPYDAIFRKYLGLISHPCANDSNLQMRDCLSSPRLYTIDASPVYYYSPGAPLLLRSFSPNSKVIMMIREPLDRLEALYHHWVLEDGKWPATSLDALAEGFFRHLQSEPGVKPVLRRLAKCSTISCQAEGWRDAAALGLLGSHDYRIFTSGLYRYALAAWRLHYLQPGHTMIIDSHTYFRDREGVIEQVVAFLYGRSMTSAEREMAKNGAARNVKHRYNASAEVLDSKPSWMLSPSNRAEVELFYDLHVLQGLHLTLEGLRSEGAWMVGFDNEPWPWVK